MSTFLSVKKPHPEGKIPCKSSPENIGDLQICGKRHYLFVVDNRKNYQGQHHQKPHKSKEICPEIEENKTPHEVEKQTACVKKQPSVGCVLILRPVKPYKGRTDTHKHVQYCPHYRKKKRGRRQGRSVDSLIYVHIVPCEKCRKSSDCKRNNNCNYKCPYSLLCFFLHKIIPFVYVIYMHEREIYTKKISRKSGRKKSQKNNIMLCTLLAHIIGPDRNLHLADVSLAQKEHTYS